MKNIGIIGTRRRDTLEDLLAVTQVFLKVYEVGDIIISGGCPKGGDRFAEIIAEKENIPIKIFPADWKKFGKAAGFIRNTDIARESDILIACVAPDRKGGTEDTITKFNKVFGKTKLYLV